MNKIIHEIEVKQSEQKVCMIPSVKLVNSDDAKNLIVEIIDFPSPTKEEVLKRRFGIKCDENKKN